MAVDLDDAVRRRRTTRAFDPDAAVAQDDLIAIVTAGLRTPSAGWTQAVELLVLTELDDRERYWQLTVDPSRTPDGQPDRWLRGMSAAPALVLVWTSEAAYRHRYAEPDKGWPLDVARGSEGVDARGSGGVDARGSEGVDARGSGGVETDRWSAPYWWVDAGMAVQTMLLTATARGVASAFVGVPPAAQPAVAAAYGVPDTYASVGLLALGHAVAGQPRSRPRRQRRPDSDRIHLARWEGS